MMQQIHPHVRGLGMASARSRKRLIDHLRSTVEARESVFEAMEAVPRHLFVDEALASRAYDNVSLPIGYGQTISQPMIVAQMTDLILGEQDKLNKVLEIGTGSGYQAAVLSHVAKMVYTVERIEQLYKRTKQHLRDLNYRNIYARHAAPNQLGLPSQGPFDAILIAAAAEELPTRLYSQMADGARMVVPVEQAGGQQLLLIERQGEHFVKTVLDDVSFVPLIVEH